jgi:biotin synthesis protein BioG
MQSCWLSKQHRSPSCILFFSGWGMDPVPFRVIPPAGYDLLMLFDYREMDRDRIANLIPAGYPRLHLLAWSMGVWAAAFLLEPLRDRFASAVAVNGTTRPIDDRYGIPSRAYEEMISDFSADTLEAFYQSMFTNRGEAEKFLRNRPRRSVEAVRRELIALRGAYLQHGPAADIFTHKFVGSRDRIFPPRGQIRAWGRDNCTVLPQPHFPFYALPHWGGFLSDG